MTVKSCRVYIDENARVYQDWDSYLIDNTLPKCVIIVPENGEYQGIIIEVILYTFLNNNNLFCLTIVMLQ